MTRNTIEIISGRRPAGHFRYALFDFDGTISVIREGWQEVMIPYMVEELQLLGTDESHEELYEIVREFVDRLTGKETIYQAMALADEISKRGGEPLDPLVYKRRYLDRLWKRIEGRVAGLKSGQIISEHMMMKGSLALLEGLRARGVELYLASGTDHKDVKAEAGALELCGYFGDRIYGALDNSREYSKDKIIRNILSSRGLSGESLMVFGDGFVEIEYCRAAGGFAVGVASDEINRCGMNEWKRNRLIAAGADIIITDYQEVEALMGFLFP